MQKVESFNNLEDSIYLKKTSSNDGTKTEQENHIKPENTRSSQEGISPDEIRAEQMANEEEKGEIIETKIGMQPVISSQQVLDGNKGGYKHEEKSQSIRVKRRSIVDTLGLSFLKNRKNVDSSEASVNSLDKEVMYINSLPKEIRHLAHLDVIKDEFTPDSTKLDYYKKFNIESKERMDWTIPRGDAERRFALDLIIDTLVDETNFGDNPTTSPAGPISYLEQLR